MAELNETTSFRRRLSLAGQLMVLIGMLSLGPLVVTNYYGYERSHALIEEMSAEADIPHSEAIVVLDDLKRQVFWMGSGFVLVVILGMLLMVRHTVGPLRELLAAASNMSRGQLAQRVDTRGPREIAELAEVFNSMSRHVAELHDTLEERVDQRTEELRQNQAFSELLFDSMDESLAVIDSDFRVVKANRAAHGTYGEDIVGKSYAEVFEGPSQPGEDCPLAEALRGTKPVECERVYESNGTSEIMHMQLFPLPPSQGQDSDRVLLVSRKITEEKQEQANQVHGGKVSAYALMAASVAHEIGNPLSSISAHLQLAARKQDPEYTEKVLEIVREQVERINRLLREITEFSVRQSSRETMVSWNQVADDALRLLRHDPRGRFAEFELDLADELPSVKANPDHCLQVLLNLGLNGLDAMDGRGTLRIATGVEDGSVVVRVTDEGPGVPEEMRQKIFEPYFSTKKSDDGTGLGLFISRRILEQSGGRLEYEDTPDAGATFVIATDIGGSAAKSSSASG